ncbi:MAG: hypothetical protein ACRDS9_07205 [Pseudonocardiaceae bacterium]
MESALENARKFFEPQLKKLGLNEKQIDDQTLEELKVSLETVDRAIDHPESFGKLRLSIGGETGAIIVKQDSSAHFEVDILPILLERRARIIARIRHLEIQADVSKIEEEIAKSPSDSTKKRSLEAELQEKKREDTRLEENMLRAQQARSAAGKNRDFDDGTDSPDQNNQDLLLQVELQARRTAIRQSWFARESVASLVGGILLLALATTMIVAMFSGTTVSEIISNAFLVILGYFFGQAVRERAGKGEPANESSK